MTPTRNNLLGRFISIEGGEGAGKSTLIQSLAQALRERGCDVMTTREPGGTTLAEDIRRLLVTGEARKMDHITEYFLFSAARRHHLKEVIIPALKRGAWVISDRFIDSSFVYQQDPQLQPLYWMQQVFSALSQDLLMEEDTGEGQRRPAALYPRLTLWLDLDPTLGLARTQGRRNQETRFEEKGHTFHHRVRERFQELHDLYPERIFRIDASGTQSQVLRHAIQLLERHLPEEMDCAR